MQYKCHVSIENHTFQGCFLDYFCIFNRNLRKKMAFVLQFAVRTGVCGRLLYCIAGELDIVIVIPTPVNMYTQFRPKIRCKLWLLLCIHIPRSRYGGFVLCVMWTLHISFCFKSKNQDSSIGNQDSSIEDLAHPGRPIEAEQPCGGATELADELLVRLCSQAISQKLPCKSYCDEGCLSA